MSAIFPSSLPEKHESQEYLKIETLKFRSYRRDNRDTLE